MIHLNDVVFYSLAAFVCFTIAAIFQSYNEVEKENKTGLYHQPVILGIPMIESINNDKKETRTTKRVRKGSNSRTKKRIRQQEQEIKQLQKELGYNQNRSKFPAKVKEKDLDQCESCGKGTLKVADLGIRTITTCTICPYRKVSK